MKEMKSLKEKRERIVLLLGLTGDATERMIDAVKKFLGENTVCKA